MLNVLMCEITEVFLIQGCSHVTGCVTIEDFTFQNPRAHLQYIAFVSIIKPCIRVCHTVLYILLKNLEHFFLPFSRNSCLQFEIKRLKICDYKHSNRIYLCPLCTDRFLGVHGNMLKVNAGNS